jgi:hypothetical protein
MTLRTRKRTRRLEERFLSRQQLAERWGLSIREIINREKTGELKPLVYRLSYKTTRFKLSDIVSLEETSKVN